MKPYRVPRRQAASAPSKSGGMKLSICGKPTIERVIPLRLRTEAMIVRLETESPGIPPVTLKRAIQSSGSQAENHRQNQTA